MYVNIIISSHSEICVGLKLKAFSTATKEKLMEKLSVVDGDVISECVYLSGLVIAYNPSGCLNKGSLLFNF